MRLGKRQQARRVTPPPIQEAMPPPRQPMVSFPTGPYDVPPPGYAPDGTMGYAPDGTVGFGPDGSPIMGYAPDGTMGYAPDGSPGMGYAPDGYPSMAYAYAPDGTPLLYGTDGPPPGYPMAGGPGAYQVDPALTGAYLVDPAATGAYPGDPAATGQYQGYPQDLTGPYPQEPMPQAAYPPGVAYGAPAYGAPAYPGDPGYPAGQASPADQGYPADQASLAQFAYLEDAAYAQSATVAPDSIPEPTLVGEEPEAYVPDMALASDPALTATPDPALALVPERLATMPESATTLVPELPQVTVAPEPVDADDIAPWPDFAPTNRSTDGVDGDGAGVERLPTATQAHRLRLGRPTADGSMPRTSEARLSRLHLRGGMLGLARASLEQLAGVDTLDTEALADLAETRWRTGDLEGAAEAAEAHLQAHGDEPIARLITAEQAAHDGRILDARQLATQVQGQLGDGLERLFAGEPRSAVWPPAAAGWMDVGAVAAGRFGLLVGGVEVAQPDAASWPTAALVDTEDPRIGVPSAVLVHTSQNAAPFKVGGQDPAEAAREADRELQAAERDLAKGDLVALADRLGLLLRRDPGLAPVILSITEHALDINSGRVIAGETGSATGPASPTQGTLPFAVPGLSSLQMLRGDILRGLGHDADATQAYQEALRALPGRAITREST